MTDFTIIEPTEIFSSERVRNIIEGSKSPFIGIQIKPASIDINKNLLKRASWIFENTSTDFVYTSFFEGPDLKLHRLNEYQLGSVREGFDFGPIWLIRTSAARVALNSGVISGHKFSGLYELRLALCLKALPMYLDEPLYTVQWPAGDKYSQFDYVDPRNRAVQIELEEAFTLYAKKAGFFIPPSTKSVEFQPDKFTNTASVVIPVRNREGTIADAVLSALTQVTKFKFNVIVVDNHSSDKTTTILADLAVKHSNLRHLTPQRKDLGIGGCWNEAINSEHCGQFAVQLDSDDLYIDQTTLQKIIDLFHSEKCAAVVGSYKLVNFKLEEIPPGLIDHREWTSENGHNNALRINGLGAPRAVYTPVARQIGFPNVSYGEDYSMMLAISRQYRIGRIYDPLYLCRRWDGNSDANLDAERANRFDAYKDKIRTIEILARLKLSGR